MHVCHEELFALLALLPGLTFLINRLRGWLHQRRGCHHNHNKEA